MDAAGTAPRRYIHAPFDTVRCCCHCAVYPAGPTKSGSTTKSVAARPLTLLLAAAVAAALVAAAAAVWVVLCVASSRRLVTLPAPPRKWCSWRGRQQVRVVALLWGWERRAQHRGGDAVMRHGRHVVCGGT